MSYEIPQFRQLGLTIYDTVDMFQFILVDRKWKTYNLQRPHEVIRVLVGLDEDGRDFTLRLERVEELRSYLMDNIRSFCTAETSLRPGNIHKTTKLSLFAHPTHRFVEVNDLELVNRIATKLILNA